MAPSAGAGEASTSGRKISEIVAYRSVAEMPAVRELVITVDQERESVLLPVYGVLVPFHITTIKGAMSNTENDHTFVRVQFNHGGAYEPLKSMPTSVFLKELSFRSVNVHMQNAAT